MMIGWTYNEKSSGPRTEPCVTPLVRVVVLDDWSPIGRASLAREIESGGSWGQEVHILHVNK